MLQGLPNQEFRLVKVHTEDIFKKDLRYFKKRIYFWFLRIPSQPGKQNYMMLFLLVFIIVKKQCESSSAVYIAELGCIVLNIQQKIGISDAPAFLQTALSTKVRSLAQWAFYIGQPLTNYQIFTCFSCFLPFCQLVRIWS